MNRSSPFLSLEKAAGANFCEWFGVELPANYGNTQKEIEAARTKAAWFDLSIRNVIEVTGEDAAGFLERLSSNHVTELKNGESVLTAFLTPQAKVVAVAYVLRMETCFWLLVQTDLTEKLIPFLEKFVITDDVAFKSKQTEYAILAIQGPDSEKELGRMGFSPRSVLVETKHADVTFENLTVTIFRKSWGKVPGYAVIFPKDMVEIIWKHIAHEGAFAKLAGMEALEVLRIENGIPCYGPDMNDEYLLPETGLENAIHYNKGCYTGQEIVARIKSRGQLKRKLVRFNIQTKSPVKNGTPISLNEVIVGHITTAAYDPTAGFVRALGYTKLEAISSSNHFQVDGADAAIV